MKNEMFDEQGKFVERDGHTQVFDHSQELPAVEVITKECLAIVAGFVNNYKREQKERLGM